MPPNASRTVFVANIPYDVSEEQIANVFSEVGPVSNVEIKFDLVTGRSKGYAFVQYYDEATAHSAVRNLQDVPINGRPVRIELSTDDGGRRGRPPFGRPMPMPMPVPGPHREGSPAHQPIDYSALPAGVEPAPGQKATDAISKVLADVNPGQMHEVMSAMKTLITTQPEEARQLLTKKPQLAYALFQAMLLMNMVDPSVLQRIQPLAPAAAPAPPPPAQFPPSTYPPYGARTTSGASAGYNSPQPHAPAPGYGGYPAPAAPAPVAPAPAAPGLPPAAQEALAALPEDQRAMLVQVLQLTPEQVLALDPTQQASIKQLRQQFLGTA